MSVIFNLTIELNVIPAEWKKAKVTPLHKSGTKDDPRNYRPISVLPVVSKVLERLIHKQLAGYFDGHNLLCKSQSGFRRMILGVTKMLHGNVLANSWPTVHRQVTDSQKWETLFTIPDSQHLNRLFKAG